MYVTALTQFTIALCWMDIGKPLPLELNPEIAGSLHSWRSIARVSTKQMRQLTHGNFLIPYEDITLLHKIGEGVAIL